MMSEDLKDQGITVNAILPSAHTKLFSGGAPNVGDNMPPAKDEHRGPDFVAPLVAFLATDEAAKINGRPSVQAARGVSYPAAEGRQMDPRGT